MILEKMDNYRKEVLGDMRIDVWDLPPTPGNSREGKKEETQMPVTW